VGVIRLNYSLKLALGELINIRDYYSQFPFVRRCALEFGAPKTDNDLPTLFANLVTFVKTKMTYVPDPNGFEYVTAPDVMLADICQRDTAYGDCDDHVLLLNTLLASIGFKTGFAAVKISPSDPMFNHVISKVSLNGRVVDVDPCAKSVPQPIYREQYVRW
jgi:hypothetical protein